MESKELDLLNVLMSSKDCGETLQKVARLSWLDSKQQIYIHETIESLKQIPHQFCNVILNSTEIHHSNLKNNGISRSDIGWTIVHYLLNMSLLNSF